MGRINDISWNKPLKCVSMGDLFGRFQADGSFRTAAMWPVWSHSSQREVKFVPVPKKYAMRIWYKARAWNRQRVAGRYGGAIGSAALSVLHSLIFDFLKCKTGQLDPSYEGLSTVLKKRGYSAESATDRQISAPA